MHIQKYKLQQNFPIIIGSEKFELKRFIKLLEIKSQI